MSSDILSIVGMGNVGEMLAYILKKERIGRQINCIGHLGGPIDRPKARVYEINNALPGLGPELVPSVDPKDLAKSGIVVITAGSPRKPEQIRDDLVRQNAKTLAGIAVHLPQYCPNAKVIVVSNPSASMTEVVRRITGFPSERVIGFGNSLDIGRDIGKFADIINVAPSDISGSGFGDHGENMCVFLEAFSVGGTPLPEYVNSNFKNPAEILAKLEVAAQEMKKASQYLIVGLKQSPWIGPAAHIARLCEIFYYAPLRCNKGSNANALVNLKGQYGLQGVIGVPVKLGRHGVIEVTKLPLSEKSLAELRIAHEHIQEVTKIALDEIGL